MAATIAVGLVPYGVNPHGEQTFVVTRGAAGTHLAGEWELPGGKVEPGETPQEALTRELEEELGIVAHASHPITFSRHAYPDRTVLLLFYEVVVADHSPPPVARVADELRLLDRAALLALPMPPANAPLLRWLRAQA